MSSRPTLMPEATRRIVIGLVRAGKTITEAAAAAGVSRQAVYRERKRDKRFAEALRPSDDAARVELEQRDAERDAADAAVRAYAPPAEADRLGVSVGEALSPDVLTGEGRVRCCPSCGCALPEEISAAPMTKSEYLGLLAMAIRDSDAPGHKAALAIGERWHLAADQLAKRLQVERLAEQLAAASDKDGRPSVLVLRLPEIASGD